MIRAMALNVTCVLTTPFADYGNLPLTLFSYEGGDVFSRVMVRIKGFLDSMAMIEYALDNFEGPLLTEGYQPYKFIGFTEAMSRRCSLEYVGDSKIIRWHLCKLMLTGL